MEKVCVMMSTYNGEKYLSEQIESILNQKDVSVLLYIRDDGSNDGTGTILKEYEQKYSNIFVQYGHNVGYAASFFNLLKNSVNDCEFYAFSDQDDVWNENKLKCAIEKIKGNENVPTLYSCNLDLVDENLQFISKMEAPVEADFCKGRYLIDKYSYGCTMVFNKKLKDLVQEHIPSCKVSHDNWLGLVAVFCGKYIFDKECYILYRQHSNNVTGGRANFISVWKRRIKNISKIKDLSRADIARDLIINFEDFFDEETMNLLNMVSEYKKSLANKIRFMLDSRTNRKSLEKNLIYKIMILFSVA